MLLKDRKILFFGGKGGVGKTTLASAFALMAAERNRRTLLVSTDAAHSTSDLLERELGSEPRPVVANLWAMEIDPEVEAAQYIADVKKRIGETAPPRLWAEIERQIDVARVSPGAEEAALFERFTRIIDNVDTNFDVVLFDTAPTGQTLRLLSLPELMTSWISGLISQRSKVNALSRMWRNVAGAAAGDRAHDHDPVLTLLEERKARFHRARHVITDELRTAFVFVVNPERLPILETEKAIKVLTKYSIPVGAVLVNRVLPERVDGDFLARRRVQEAEYLQMISRSFDGIPVRHIPLLERDVSGLEALRRVIAAFPQEQPVP